MRRATINNQEDRARGSNQETFEEFDKDIGIDPAFFLYHEAHATARRHRRDQAHAVAGAGCLDDRRLAAPGPGSAGVVIRAHMCRVTEIDFSFRLLGQGFDLRVLFSERRTSASSRSKARARSFWQVMPSWARSRPTETRLNVILNLSLINLATISRVHNAKAHFLSSVFF